MAHRLPLRPTPPYPYDPQQALKLLTQAGYSLDQQRRQLTKNGQELTFTFVGPAGDDEAARMIREIEANLLDVGIRLQIAMVPSDEILGAIVSRHTDLYYLYSRAYQNPTLLVSFWSGDARKALFPYQSAALQKLYEEFFQDHRLSPQDFLRRFQDTLYRDPPGVFLYWKESGVVLHRRIQGANFSAQGFWDTIWRWSLN